MAPTYTLSLRWEAAQKHKTLAQATAVRRRLLQIAFAFAFGHGEGGGYVEELTRSISSEVVQRCRLQRQGKNKVTHQTTRYVPGIALDDGKREQRKGKND